jgi:hypothetical protein
LPAFGRQGRWGNSCSGCFLCFGIDGHFRKLGQRLVRLLLFVQRLLEELGGLRHMKPVSQGDESAVARNFVVLNVWMSLLKRPMSSILGR